VKVNAIRSGGTHIEIVIEENKSRRGLAIFDYKELPILIKGVDMLLSSPSICMVVKKFSRRITLIEPKNPWFLARYSTLQGGEIKGFQLELLSEGLLMCTKRPSIPSRLKPVNYLLRDLQLDPDVPNELITPTFQESSCVSPTGLPH
jgi:hypothetical protein